MNLREEILISVIIPIYNLEDYVGKCLDSVINQSYKNLDIILIDDGSKDKTPQICDLYAASDPRIRVVHIKNSGVSNARNIGIEMAKGQWITFVDGDDFINENYVSEMLTEVHISPDCDFVCAGYVMGEKIYRFPKTCIKDGAQLAFLQQKTHYGFVWGKLFKTELIRDNSLRFNPEIKWSEDYFFILRYLRLCKCIILSDSVAYNYIYRPFSAAKRTYNFENEIAGYNEAINVQKLLISDIGEEVTEYLNTYRFLYRSVYALYFTSYTRTQRLKILRSIEVNSRRMKIEASSWKEDILGRMIVARCWPVVDLLFSKLVKH